jgi:hypothetical protein
MCHDAVFDTEKADVAPVLDNRAIGIKGIFTDGPRDTEKNIDTEYADVARESLCCRLSRCAMIG